MNELTTWYEKHGTYWPAPLFDCSMNMYWENQE